MKNTIFMYFLFSIIVGIQMFFKHHYEATLDIIKVEYLNTSLGNMSFGMHFLNRTVKAMHGFAVFFTDLSDDSYVGIEEYHMYSNEYRLTAIQFEMKFRKALQLDLAGVQTLFHHFSPTLSWPIRKNVVYKLNNWVQDSSKIPFPYAPTGKWKMLLSIYADRKITKILDLGAYNTIIDVPDL